MTYRYTAQFRKHYFSIYDQEWLIAVMQEQHFDERDAAFDWAMREVYRQSWYCDAVVVSECFNNGKWEAVSTVEIAPDGSREVVA